MTIELSRERLGPTAASGPMTAAAECLRIESCHGTWLLDQGRMRFRRVLPGRSGGLPACTTGWRPYFGLERSAGSDSFVVRLNAEGTRLIRAWLHGADCPHCGPDRRDYACGSTRH